ncbi:3-ketoacyl-ACP reductase [Puniceibacterium sediminis]|uniref:NAD(P)-dependent dehydrogenase, short-chain alcohol dehydrogenase family n=1 Tax=Puniceibacterium sediminis TaxID=1608407 RepID=A0A238XNJ7_9RHOB|nr:3-ketoacyl-ACP reductase [Puniceibacterium sediminis]SNR60111.1 NAD(P)-dependent dehydrogenase, short-chain alcohol dehydrogenase family [Puniceibacterium sediminis]
MTPHALITGGQQGIGLGIASVLADAGWQVTLAAEAAPESGAVVDALAQLGPNARYIRHDLSDLNGIGALLDQAGPITTYVSNAGVPARVRGDMLDLLPENYDFTMDINLRGAFFLAQAVARNLLVQPVDPYRSMLFVTSASAEMVSVERAEYCLSKAGAAMMAKLFAVRLAQAGIGVFELRPGIIASPMTAGVQDSYTPRIEAGLVPARRWGMPGDIGQAVLPLARGDMQFATGAVIPLDGGLSIPRL